MSAPPRWGVICTTNAPRDEVLGFAAHHLELGAHRLYIYLDEAAPETEAALRAHPKVRVVRTDAAYWAKRRGRPERHQARQVANARHATGRPAETDWLCHIDVDEMLWPEGPDIAGHLATLPESCLCARVRPVESLSGGDAGITHFKAFHPDRAARQAAAGRVFPTFGTYLDGGFLSHVEGKLFLRTGVPGLRVRIHNVVRGEEWNPGEAPLAGVALCHLHAASWEAWQKSYRYRLRAGSYRAELRPKARGSRLNLHALFAEIEAQGGEPALRAFFEEVCVAAPELLSRLAAEGLLRSHALDLDAKRARHFRR